MQIASTASASFPGRSAPTTAPPLTHHEIIRLIAPFTRRGRHADLAASDRSARKLVFRSIEHPVDASPLDGLRETLQLEHTHADQYRLSRALTLPAGLTATLTVDGLDPARLLEAIESVPLPHQFAIVADRVIAQSYRLDGAAELVLTSAEVRFDGLTLRLKAETGKGYPAEIMLQSSDGSLDLPDDVLAVLGWDWAVLRPRGSGWTASLKMRGSEPKRSRALERKLLRTVAHLAATLSQPPQHFHAQQATARWGVVFRRAIPLLFCIGLIAGTIGLTFLKIPTDSMLQMLVFNLPPLLLMVLFGMREVPRLEIPPLPRPSTAAAWKAGATVT